MNGSWADLTDQVPDQGAQLAAENYEAATKYKIFTTGQGREVLNDLVARTLAQPTWDSNRGLLESIPWSYMREGQNSIVAFIIQQIEIAEQGPPAPASDAPTQGSK